MKQAIPEIFSRAVYLARQAKASAQAAQGPMIVHVAEELSDRLSVINHTFAKVGVISNETEVFQNALSVTGKFQTIEILPPPATENLNLAPQSYNALFSLLDLHCVNDVPGYLAQCAKALKPDGLFMCCFFAGDTLIELRESWLAAEADLGSASPRVAPMVGLREMGGLLQRAGLALPVADSDRLRIRYANVLALLLEVKSFGFANPLKERRTAFTSPRALTALAEHYKPDDDGRVGATLELFWAMAWKPHESQPKPKAPGSATVRFEDALKNHSNEK